MRLVATFLRVGNPVKHHSCMIIWFIVFIYSCNNIHLNCDTLLALVIKKLFPTYTKRMLV